MENKIIELLNLGLTTQQVADDLDCSISFILLKIKELSDS